MCNAVQAAARTVYERNGFILTNQWNLPYYLGLGYASLCLYQIDVSTSTSSPTDNGMSHEIQTLVRTNFFTITSCNSE